LRQRNGIVTVCAALVFFVAFTACASKPVSTASGANTLEGGVKIPTSSPAPTVSTVRVTLGDTRGAAGPMSLTLSPSSVPAGDVTFVVKNAGTIVHEAVVLKTNVPYNRLPVTYGGDPPVPVATGANKVSEAANIGETGDPDLVPGATRTFTIKNMTAGNYVVVCNVAGHYTAGMRAPLKVG
jgi:uncharacterized cupredoxin-like copper-binding protein